uniref:Deacetylase sirtuin-type domain-containing protein n=1 Tax=Leptobrachium leishanense TaxID=445787 RepID=A0A8C5QS85_9ANUR
MLTCELLAASAFLLSGGGLFHFSEICGSTIPHAANQHSRNCIPIWCSLGMQFLFLPIRQPPCCPVIAGYSRNSIFRALKPSLILTITYNPRPFFTLARELYPGKYKPNIVHYFVRLLHDKGLLMRCYKQYIDGLEMIAGIPQRKLVEAHGTFSSAGCHLLQFFSCKGSSGKILDCIMNGWVPRCKTCSGVVKPDIDFPRADLLIVMGTSLKVTLPGLSFGLFVK